MKRTLVAASLLWAAMFAHAQEINPEWHGSIEVPNDAPLRLALHMRGAQSATLDSVDEGVSALAVDSMSVNGPAVTFEIKSIGGVYQGMLSGDGSHITGTWSQDGGAWPLIWEVGEDPGNTIKPVSAGVATEAGRAFTRLFYEGKLDELWRRLSPVLQQALRSKAELAQLRDESLQRLGAETEVMDERVETSGVLQVYRRFARFEKSRGGAEFSFTFDPRGMAASLSIR